ncbi:MAG TPA: Crp/Fnr family transcriptional regulator [Candidatus Methylomirabilis sp.]|nr:Crp/Fnr family transcriptional regulator [Candidatus Methylomirabilis sp.]
MSSCDCELNACVLCEARLYPGLSSELVCRIRNLLIRETYSPHQTMFWEGDTADFLFALKAGQVKLTTSLPDGRQQILRLAIAGQLLGFESLSGRKYSYTAEALTEAHVCKINRRDLFEVIQQNPAVSVRVIEALSQELEQAEMTIRDLGLKSSTERVASFLLSLMPGCDGPKKTMSLLLSRREMAEMLGLTEETVSRVMADFARREIIENGKGCLRILNPGWLRAHSGIANGLAIVGSWIILHAATLDAFRIWATDFFA